MNKSLSTYERKMQDKKFRKAYEKSYKELLFSELLISIMNDDHKSVRALAKEADLSPSVIQDIRSGRQQDIKTSNLIKIAHAFGYEVILRKEKEDVGAYEESYDAGSIRLAIQEDETSIYALQNVPALVKTRSAKKKK